MKNLGELFEGMMNHEFQQSENVQSGPGNIDHVLKKDSEFLELVASDLLHDKFDELQKVQILPTGKTETRYLLGIEKNEDKNPIEQFMEQAIGERTEYEVNGHYDDRRHVGGFINDDGFADQKYSGTFENLMKKYE
jgi:hypothetical protein